GAGRLVEYPLGTAEPAQRRAAVPDRAMRAVHRHAGLAKSERAGRFGEGQWPLPLVGAADAQPAAAAAGRLADREPALVLLDADLAHMLLEQEGRDRRELLGRH